MDFMDLMDFMTFDQIRRLGSQIDRCVDMGLTEQMSSNHSIVQAPHNPSLIKLQPLVSPQPKPKSEPHQNQTHHRRVKEALITQIETPTSRGHYVYKIERGSRDCLIYLSPTHPKFDQFREHLQLNTIHRFIISTTITIHLGRERLPIWELIDVTPLSTTHRTVTIADIRPYQSRPQQSTGSVKISEVVLSTGPLKIGRDPWPLEC
jgi:hypothetical protein